jgi:hypothetical protein
VISISDSAVRGVQLTKLLPDGLDRLRDADAKITIGRAARGLPIVIAPPNDLLGLAVTEGIEDGLSVYEASGLGVWAAGGAGRMPALASTVPAFIECVSVIAHDDGGRKHAEALAAALLARNIPAKRFFLKAPSP